MKDRTKFLTNFMAEALSRWSTRRIIIPYLWHMEKFQQGCDEWDRVNKVDHNQEMERTYYSKQIKNENTNINRSSPNNRIERTNAKHSERKVPIEPAEAGSYNY